MVEVKGRPRTLVIEQEGSLMESVNDTKIAVVGLGYVGLPLAGEFGKKLDVVGYDINPRRIAELKAGSDHTLGCRTRSWRTQPGWVSPPTRKRWWTQASTSSRLLPRSTRPSSPT